MKHTKDICPICEEGFLISKVSKEMQIYKNKTYQLDMFYSECDCCGSETATSEQIRLNKREMIKLQKTVDCLLSSDEIKTIRTSLGLSIKQAGLIFGGGPVAFSKYENDDLIQSIPMDTALRLVQINPHSVQSLAKARNIDLPKKPLQVGTPLHTLPMYENFSSSERTYKVENDSNSIPTNIIQFQNNGSFFEVLSNVH